MTCHRRLSLAVWLVLALVGPLSLLAPVRALKVFKSSLAAEHVKLDHVKANFGPSKFNVTAVLAAMSPEDGCEEPDSEGNSSSSGVHGKIALVIRGDCDFSVKAAHAEQAGAVGIVVGNNKKKDDCVEMQDEDNLDISIPSVFVQKDDYLFLLNITQTVDTAYVMLDKKGERICEPDLGTNILILGYLLLIVPTVWCLIIAIIIVRRVVMRLYGKCKRTRRLQTIPVVIYQGPDTPALSADDALADGSDKETPMEARDVELVVTNHGAAPMRSQATRKKKEGKKEYLVLDKDEDTDEEPRTRRGHGLGVGALVGRLLHKAPVQPQNETCAVCLDDFARGDRVKVLPCSHGFHPQCIDPWLSGSSEFCPVCKRSIFDKKN